MDNVDGKQARRTGTSSGLGELFDHGIDSLNCTLGSLLETAAMGLGPTKTEGLILACTIMILSGYYGPQIWQSPLSDFFDLPLAYQAYTVRDIWVAILLISFATAHLPSCVLNVASARRSRGQAVLPVFLEWTPMLIYTAATAAWMSSPYSRILKDNHLLLHCLTQSFVFGRMTTKIILAHLTRQQFPYWTVLMAPLVGGAVLTNLPRIGIEILTAETELLYMRAYFVFALIVYFRWAFLVVGSICKFLGINCLTIPTAKQRELNGKAH
ncbi:hypothetical protein MRB53_036837 [Persea americana]|nr:hypothetical protein MRB53_036837 [Persea americana]